MTIVNIYQSLIQGVMDANLSGYPVKWPNTQFDTPNNAPYLRTTVLNMDDLPVTLGTGGLNEVSGVMQVDIFVPKLNGYLPALNTSAEIKDILKTGAKLTHNGQCVRINSAPSRQATSEDTWFQWVITVNYTAYLTRG